MEEGVNVQKNPRRDVESREKYLRPETRSEPAALWSGMDGDVTSRIVLTGSPLVTLLTA